MKSIDEISLNNAKKLFKTNDINKIEVGTIKGLKDMYGENKLIIMIIKSLIFFIKENLNDIFPDKKRSCNPIPIRFPAPS